MNKLYIIQGAYNDYVLSLIENLLNLDSSAKVIFSHYDSEISVLNEFNDERFFELLIKDPGSDFNLKKFKPTNIYRQISTSFSCDSSKFITKGIIFKMRSDLIISSRKNFIKCVKKIEMLFEKNKELELICLQNGTFNPYGRYKYPFHCNDWFYASRCERFKELETYFLNKKKSDLELNYFEHKNKPSFLKLTKYISRYQAEQLVHFADRFNQYEMEAGPTFEKSTLVSFNNFVKKNLWIVPISKSGLKLSKRPRGIGVAHKFCSISELDIFIIRNLPKGLEGFYLYIKGKATSFFWYPVNIVDKIMRRFRFID